MKPSTRPGNRRETVYTSANDSIIDPARLFLKDSKVYQVLPTFQVTRVPGQ
jgi:hypothetical protein